jgi:hypothetical protein
MVNPRWASEMPTAVNSSTCTAAPCSAVDTRAYPNSTCSGIPIRTWCWPGNTTDTAVLAQARADLRVWKLTRVVWVTDRGFATGDGERPGRSANAHPAEEVAACLGEPGAREPSGKLPVLRRQR